MSTFSKKYKVLGKVGEGSFAEVLKCQERTTGVLYAAKRLKKVKESMDEALTTAELRTLEQLQRHPNILYMIEKHVDPLPGKMTIIFELMDMSLYDMIKTRKRPIPEIRCKEYLYQILKGLSHLHKNGIFHRDIKPENILLKGKLVKIADLGSVKGMYQRQPHTEYISTRWYRAPECLLTKGIYGPKMDIWAAGCVYYELLTLRPLFPGSNEVDMLTKIHNIMGTPSTRTISKFKRYRSRNVEYWFPSRAGIGVCSMLPNVSEAGRDIFKQMLVYDPDLRSNVRRLLDHRYFNDLREIDESPHRRSCSEDRPPRSPMKPREWRNPLILSYINDKKKKTKRTITKKNVVTEPPQKQPRVVASNPTQQPTTNRLNASLHTHMTVPSHRVKLGTVRYRHMETSKLHDSNQPTEEPRQKNMTDARLPPIQKAPETKSIPTLGSDGHSHSLPVDMNRNRILKTNEKAILDIKHLPSVNNRPVQSNFSDRMKNEQLVANLTKDLYSNMKSNASMYAVQAPEPNKIKSSRIFMANLPPASCLRLPPINPKKYYVGEPVNYQQSVPKNTYTKSFSHSKAQMTLNQKLETIQEKPTQLNRRMHLICP